jgi:large subunit ribosomal protein L21
MYAIVRSGGKQYRVREGDSIVVERLAAEPGADVQLDVLLLDRDGAVSVGTPTVAGATVGARVTEHLRADKVISFKYKNKTRRRQQIGHRQQLTRLAITSVGAGPA